MIIPKKTKREPIKNVGVGYSPSSGIAIKTAITGSIYVKTPTSCASIFDIPYMNSPYASAEEKTTPKMMPVHPCMSSWEKDQVCSSGIINGMNVRAPKKKAIHVTIK